MAQDDPGHLTDPQGAEERPRTGFTQLVEGAEGPAPDPAPAAPRRGRALPWIALALAVLALVLAFVPYACFAAGLPALAAVVLGFVGTVAAGRRSPAVAAIVIGAVALVAAVTVSAVQISGAVARFSAGAGQVVSQLPGAGPTPAPGLAAGPHRITYAVTGDGRASISYSALVDGTSGVDRESAVTVPHARTQRVTVERSGSAAQFVMIVVASDATKRTGCAISIDGRVVATRSAGTSSGGSGVVTCTARTGS